MFLSRAKFLSRVKQKKEMQFLNCISNFVRRMRLELTRPCDHYPLKVACIPISPPAQGLFEKLSGKRDSNPRPQPWQGCALPTELFPHLLRKCEIFATLGIKIFFSKTNLVCFKSFNLIVKLK